MSPTESFFEDEEAAEDDDEDGLLGELLPPADEMEDWSDITVLKFESSTVEEEELLRSGKGPFWLGAGHDGVRVSQKWDTEGPQCRMTDWRAGCRRLGSSIGLGCCRLVRQ
ncbi:hypothetical protein M378DRAFT_18443 [Amanita muscaria Koide BX008]|uniref:Uncharacterized protein n=1 Tax=Amanita muscaria (strain Koide BX008) TaxID=946122 RepID=A0A0C2WFK2_AMAMK|nr:hypothetical protein M378DRAFT_18443 [Amanita muscaria Koide BX008]